MAKGNILSAAARKGEVSYASAQGGIYTISFMQALYENISYLNRKEPNWDKLILNTIESARQKSRTCAATAPCKTGSSLPTLFINQKTICLCTRTASTFCALSASKYRVW